MGRIDANGTVFKRFITACLTVAALVGQHVAAQDPRLPIGLNTMWVNYYGPELMFNDLATTLGGGTGVDAMGNYGTPGTEWMTRDEGDWEWNTQRQGAFEYDADGYPLEVPGTVNDGGQSISVTVHAIFNNSYPAGTYLVLYQGEGDISVHDARGAGIYEIDNQPGRVSFHLSGNNLEAIETGGDCNFGNLEITNSAHIHNKDIDNHCKRHNRQIRRYLGNILDTLNTDKCRRQPPQYTYNNKRQGFRAGLRTSGL